MPYSPDKFTPIIDKAQVGLAYKMAQAESFEQGQEIAPVLTSYNLKADAVLRNSPDSFETSKVLITRGEGLDRYKKFLRHLAGLQYCVDIKPLPLHEEVDVDDERPLFEI